MNRSPMPRPSKPMAKMSEKRRAELGGNPTSTFAPKRPQLKTSAMKQRRPQPAVPVDVRTALAERSGGWCEAQLERWCTGQATDAHHRIKRQSGGRHGEAKERSDRLSNVLHLCRSCHHWAHWKCFGETNPLGLILRQHDNPMQEPVLYRGEPKYLSDDGRVWALEEVGA